MKLRNQFLTSCKQQVPYSSLRVLAAANGTSQQLLDTPLEERFRITLTAALFRLARKSALYPQCFALTDVVCEGVDPVTYGGYGDIYRGYFQGRVVCLKVVRAYANSDPVSLFKVRLDFLGVPGSHSNAIGFRSRGCLVGPTLTCERPPILWYLFA